MTRTTIRTTFTTIGLAALASVSIPQAAVAADAISFEGKTVTMTIGNAAGGGTDVYGRALGRALMPHLPGKPKLVVLNQPGAGGVVALNTWVRRATADGLSVTIGAQSQTDPASLTRTHAQYDPTTFKYVGGVTAHSQALMANSNAVKRLYDKSAAPVIMGIVGSTLRGGMYQALWGAEFLGWNVKWVHGYSRSSDLRQALERSEIDMTAFGSLADIQYLLATGKFTAVSQSGSAQGGERLPRPVLGKTPIFFDLVKGKIL